MTYTLIRTRLQVWDQVLDAPVTGTVIVTPSAVPIKDVTDNRLLFSPNVVHLDADGWYEADLPASDDPSLTPSGFGYTFDIRTRSFNYSFTTQVRLADATEVTEVNPDTGLEYTHWELDLTGLAPVLPEVPISEAEALRDQMLALEASATTARDQADAARIAAEAVGNTNDTIMAGVASDDASAFLAALTNNGNRPTGKGELIFNVMDFGAVGDGVTGDSAAFNAALDAAKSAALVGPAVVWAPWTPKGYRLDGLLAIETRVTLRGERRVRLRRTGAGASFFINSNAACGWTIEGFTFDDSLGLTASSMIRAGTGTRDYTIRNNKFVGGALGISRAVISKKLISNVATIELDEAPTDLEVGSIIHISQVDNTFDGEYVATAVSLTAPYTVQFALVGADVSQGTAKNPLPVYDGWLNGETRRTVISKACSTNTVTLETSAAHGFSVGEYVYVTGVEGENDGGADITMNGTVEILSVPDATHFTYTKTHADLATTPSAGTVGIDTQAHINSGFGANAIDHQNGVVGGVIEDNWFDGLENSIRIPDTRRLTVRGNLFTNWTSRCFYIVGQLASASEDLTVVFNRIRDMHIGGEIRQAVAIQTQNASFPHKRTLIAYNSVVGVDKAWTAPDPGGADQISLHNCDGFRVIGNYSAFGGDLGINVSGGSSRGVIANNVCEHNDTAGINIGANGDTSSKDIAIVGNVLGNNGQSRNGDRGTQAAISFAGNGQGIGVTGNVIFDDQATPTTLVGMYFRDTSDVDLGNNSFRNIATRYDFFNATGNERIHGLPVPNTVTLTAPTAVAGNGDAAEVEIFAADPITPLYLEVGQVWNLGVYGTFDCIDNPGVINLRLRINGAVAGTYSMVSSGVGAPEVGAPWTLDAKFIIEAVGEAGVVTTLSTAEIVTGSANTRTPSIQQDVGVARDLSAQFSVTVGANTNTPDPGNNVRVTRAWLTKVV